jgi:hypothetical protein
MIAGVGRASASMVCIVPVEIDFYHQIFTTTTKHPDRGGNTK